MKICFQILMFTLLFVFASCTDEARNEIAGSVPVPTEKGISMNVSQLSDPKDYVCGMTLDNNSIVDTMSYKGKLYGFCSHECRDAFKTEPETYLNQK